MQVRKVQVWLLFSLRMVQTIMRTALAPLIVFICDDLECTGSKGVMLSAFSLGYVSTQVIGGVLADKCDQKMVIFVGTFLAGVMTICAGQAHQVDTIWRETVIMGMCQGPLFPTSVALIAKWVPPNERSWASTMLDSGISVGALIVLPLSGSLAISVGWRMTLCLYGVVTILYSFAWLAIASPDPEKCALISDEELALLRRLIPGDPVKSGTVKSGAGPTPGGGGGSGSLSPLLGEAATLSTGAAADPDLVVHQRAPRSPRLPMRALPQLQSATSAKAPLPPALVLPDPQLLQPKPKQASGRLQSSLASKARMLVHPAVLCVYFAHSAFNTGVYFTVQWTPTYYQEQLGISPDRAALHFMLPQV
jgi:predicted MFS family arabinose efflux permease